MTGLRPLIVALSLALPAPAFAQGPDGPSLMERGLRMFMDGLLTEMEPALRDLEGLAEGTRPLLDRMQEQLGAAMDELDAYEAPEILPNGDILIRRKAPLGDALPEAVEENPDGSIDL